MKRSMHLAVWGATAAASLAFTAIPLQAQNNYNGSEPTRTGENAGLLHGKMLGRLERAHNILGSEVFSSDQQRLGKLDDFVVDLDSGRILYAVIGSGGLLGAGERRVAVPPGAFLRTNGSTERNANSERNEGAGGYRLELNVDKEKLSSAPQITREMEKPESIGQSGFISQVYQYYGQSAGWMTASGATDRTFNNVRRASDLVRTKVENANNETVGKVEDLVVDLPMGHVVYMVFSPSRRLDLGDNLYALPPNILTWNVEQKTFVSDIGKEKLQAAPHFAKDDWSNLSDPSFASQVYHYYGKQPFFQTGENEQTTPSLKPTGRNNEILPPKQQDQQQR